MWDSVDGFGGGAVKACMVQLGKPSQLCAFVASIFDLLLDLLDFEEVMEFFRVIT